MNLIRCITAAAILPLLLAACSASPSTVDDAPSEKKDRPIETSQGDDTSDEVEEKSFEGSSAFGVDRSQWSEARRSLDDDIDAFLAQHDQLDHVLEPDRGINDFVALANERKFLLDAFARKLHEFALDPDDFGGEEELSWAYFRLGQLYLSHECSMRMVTSSDDLWPHQADEYEATLNEVGANSVRIAMANLSAVPSSEVAPWTELAQGLVENLSPATHTSEQVCQATADYWQLDGDGAHLWMASCDEGRRQSCYFAAREAAPEQRAEYAELACTFEPFRCLSSARKLIGEGQIEAGHHLLLQGCEQDHLASCRERIQFYDEGLVDIYRASCKEGDGLACVQLGRVLAEESDGELGAVCRDAEPPFDAADDLEGLCIEDGDWKSCWGLGARRLPVDEPWVVVRATDSAQDGDGYGRVSGVGVVGTTEPPSEDEMSITKSQCDDGDASACLQVGKWKRRDSGDFLPYYERACDGGELEGCHLLGDFLLHSSDDDVERDRALSLLHQACDGDFSRACARIGSYLRYHQQDDEHHEAITDVWSRACDSGHVNTCRDFGGYLIEMQEQREFHDDITSTLNRACQGDASDSCRRLGGYLIEAQEDSEFHDDIVDTLRQECDGETIRACDLLGEYLIDVQEDDDYHAEIVRALSWRCGETTKPCRTLSAYFRTRGDDVPNRTCAKYYRVKPCVADLGCDLVSEK